MTLVIILTFQPQESCKGIFGNMTTVSTISSINLPDRSMAERGFSRPALVGYWHNWHIDSAAFVPLRDVSPAFDVINVAFAVADPHRSGKLCFEPCPQTTVDELKSDIADLKKRGKKILLSAGGAGGSVSLENFDQFLQFSDSLESLLDMYGFDGVDIDLEGTLRLEPGDDDFRNPVSPSVVYLIKALRKLKKRRGQALVISLAPQVAYAQGGFCAYQGVQGSYLPVIENLRDVLDYVHVQHYNARPQKALDGKIYEPNQLDFHIAMAEMLLAGFPVGGRREQFFSPLHPAQLSIGLPSTGSIVENGYLAPGRLHSVLACLSGQENCLEHYRLQTSSGYPGFGTLMTWSINWDAASGFSFSTFARQSLDSLL